MSTPAVEVRLVTEAEHGAVTALLVAQLREHHVETPAPRIASAVRAILRHPERGKILVAVTAGGPGGGAGASLLSPPPGPHLSAPVPGPLVAPPGRPRGARSATRPTPSRRV